MIKNLIGTEHRSDFPYVYNVGGSKINVRLRTPKGEVDKVQVGYNDPYDYKDGQWQEVVMDMQHKLTDDMYDWWEATLDVAAKRFSYNFKISHNESVYYFTEAGLSDEWNVGYQFALSYAHESEVFHYPEWIDSAIWYQIFPDRFASSTPLLQWHDGAVTNEDLYGGNIQGIISKLDYLNELGINAIYFTPIFKADTAHKYDTVDYLQIDPQFGTEEDFIELIEKAHLKGIRIMLDGVFNHMSNKNEVFMDVIKNKESSKYKDWFYINDYNGLEEALSLNHIQFEKKQYYEAFAFSPNMPKLKTQNPDVKQYIFKAVEKWTKLGIDGWRLDVANEVDHQFWKDFNKLVTSINREIYIVGEIWHDSQTWLRGDEFHAVMNYKYTNAMIDFFFRKSIDKQTFENRISRSLMENTELVNKAAFNLFDSHDTERVINMCNHDLDRLRVGLLYMFTQFGSPCIYYGTEIGMHGKQDPDNRRLMQWDDMKWDGELLEFYKELIKLRLTHSVLRNDGEFKFIEHDKLVIYKRYNDNDQITVYINASDQQIDVTCGSNILMSNGYENQVLKGNGFVVVEDSDYV